MAKKILVIDDEPNSVLFIKYNLEVEGYKVYTASNGEEGLHLASEIEPDLIISDIMMPRMNGYELCRSLKNDLHTQDIPIILLSAKGMVSDRVRGLKMGADDYITKPFDPDELVTRMEVILQTRGERRKDESKGINGSLSEMALTDLIQMLKMGRKTGVLTIVHGSSKGEIYFQEGQVVNCISGVVDGEDAFFRLMNWKNGTFRFYAKDVDMQKSTINASIENLLMEGSRLSDEIDQMDNLYPLAESRLRLTEIGGTFQWNLNAEEELILSLSNLGLTWGELKEISPMGDYITCQTMVNLLFSGTLEEDDSDGNYSVTTVGESPMRHLLKLVVQLKRNVFDVECLNINIADFFRCFSPLQVDMSRVWVVSIVTVYPELAKNILASLCDEDTSKMLVGNEVIHFGRLSVDEFLVYLVILPLEERYQFFNNILMRLSTGKITVLEGSQNVINQLQQIGSLVYDSLNRHHAVTLIKTSSEEILQRVKERLLKENEKYIRVFSYDDLDRMKTVSVLETLFYSFLPGNK